MPSGGFPQATPASPINHSFVATAAPSHAAAKVDEDPFVVPSSRRNQAPADPLPGAYTPAWMNPGAPRCTVPTTPNVTAFGGWGGGFGPFAPTPLTAGYGGGSGAGYGAATPRGPQPCQMPDRGGYGGAYGADTPLFPASSYGGYGARTPGQPKLELRETSGQNGDIYKSTWGK